MTTTTRRAATMRELETIHKIADRMVTLYQSFGQLDGRRDQEFARTGITHEVLIVHEEVIPLRLDELLAARDGDFAHDVCGIHRYLEHGKRPQLKDGFCPRFAVV